MDLRQLRAVVAVADHRSFSAAAYALGTVQSNVSAHVARLEAELGAVLVDRAVGELTEEGRLVVDRARRVADELEGVRAAIAGMRHEVAGVARVGMIGTTARWLAPQVLTWVASRHRLLRTVVVEGTTLTLEPQLQSGSLDVAVISLPVHDSDIAITPLFEEDLMLVVRHDDPRAARPSVSMAEVASMELLLPLPGTALREELDAGARRAGVTLQPRAEIDGIRLIASLAFEEMGSAVLPATAVPSYLREQWRSVPVPELSRRVIGVAQRRRGLPSAATRAVLEGLGELVQEPGHRPPGVHPLN